MSDDLTAQFFNWFDSLGPENKEITAKSLENSISTIGKWRSRGIPKGKKFSCEKLLSDDLAQKVSDLQQANAVIPLAISQEQFRNWNKAAMKSGKEGMLIEDWAIAALDQLASEEPLVAGITPLSRPPMVAEEEGAYHPHGHPEDQAKTPLPDPESEAARSARKTIAENPPPYLPENPGKPSQAQDAS